jgi:hypothetical protein
MGYEKRTDMGLCDYGYCDVEEEGGVLGAVRMTRPVSRTASVRRRVHPRLIRRGTAPPRGPIPRRTAPEPVGLHLRSSVTGPGGAPLPSGALYRTDWYRAEGLDWVRITPPGGAGAVSGVAPGTYKVVATTLDYAGNERCAGSNTVNATTDVTVPVSLPCVWGPRE